MPMPKDDPYVSIQENIVNSWKGYVDQLETTLDSLEEEIEDASHMASTCTSEWCEATEHVIDEISNSLFSISEPRGASDEDSRRIKDMKKKIHDLYAKYKSTADQ